MVDSVSVRLKTLASRKNAFKHSYTVEYGNRLRVGVRAKSASVSGLRVGPSKRVKVVLRSAKLQASAPNNSI